MIKIGDKIRFLQEHTNKSKGIRIEKWGDWHIVNNWNFVNINSATKSMKYEVIRGYKNEL